MPLRRVLRHPRPRGAGSQQGASRQPRRLHGGARGYGAGHLGHSVREFRGSARFLLWVLLVAWMTLCSSCETRFWICAASRPCAGRVYKPPQKAPREKGQAVRCPRSSRCANVFAHGWSSGICSSAHGRVVARATEHVGGRHQRAPTQAVPAGAKRIMMAVAWVEASG